MAPVAPLLLLSLLCGLFVDRGEGACAEVDSDTEAVAGRGFKLGCISCKKRSEVQASATVEWFFSPTGESDFKPIYTYNENGPSIEHDQFMDRIDWNGSKRSNDIQDASIYLFNVTFNDSGTYQCFLYRTLIYTNDEYHDDINKVVHLTVVAKGTMYDAVMKRSASVGLLVSLIHYLYRLIIALSREINNCFLVITKQWFTTEY
uniref:Sodium channel regulatory subunit beta-1 n=1 Tax=Cyprinodon variegatus TaxID=28743 RepID=A0A3Q2D723_CYPVA